MVTVDPNQTLHRLRAREVLALGGSQRVWVVLYTRSSGFGTQ